MHSTEQTFATWNRHRAEPRRAAGDSFCLAANFPPQDDVKPVPEGRGQGLSLPSAGELLYLCICARFNVLRVKHTPRKRTCNRPRRNFHR